ncbi:hypothetical protein RDWZM_004615 [Blomia tropicalis]|uniref:PPM-type phosphatase domain-containing protein n=1 Tax=Blomia tropicalis TaxID=40697 RepID=A0A9Q0M565_BLOTA|nr:hypothetical protein BLOT_016231 [Blomia tropicalis]KAJ6218803.1 hypothetical protein RDWZM_004615 [Blomia tropicalis]
MAAIPSPYLTKAITKIDIDEGRGPNYSYAAANCQGWRKTQEDAHFALVKFQQNTSLFGVFDGHNGPEVAKFVATHFPIFLAKNISYNSGQIERGIQEVFMLLDETLMKKEANDELLKYREKQNSLTTNSGTAINQVPVQTPAEMKNMPNVAVFTGSTGCVLLIKNDIYYCANVGDTRCMVARDSKAHLLSKDHKPDQPEERERIERAGGTVAYGRINMCIDVSRAFGDFHLKNNPKFNSKEQMVTAWPFTMVEQVHSKSDQFIVLMCDGIWNAMTNQDVVDYVRRSINRNVPLVKICEDIIRQILPATMPESGIIGKDNMTVMIIRPVYTTLEQSSSKLNSASKESAKMRLRDQQVTNVKSSAIVVGRKKSGSLSITKQPAPYERRSKSKIRNKSGKSLDKNGAPCKPVRSKDGLTK